MIFLDVIWCGFRYGAGYTDYDVIGFYKLSHKQRVTMITRGKNDKIVKKLNKREYWHLFNNKSEFNEMFAKYIGREWILLNPNEDDLGKFREFVSKFHLFFAKPNDGQCGKGIQKIDIVNIDNILKENNIKIEQEATTGEYTKEMLISDSGKLYDKKIKALYDYLIQNKLYLIEEPIDQHEDMLRLNSSSVNTIRLVTVMNEKEEVTFMASFVRIGNGVNVVDNFNSGGMTAKLDIDTGKIIEDAINKEGKIFSEHPLTKTKIEGFQIPCFEEAKQMVIEACKLSKNVRYIGWDVAITKNGPILVEGNQFPGHDIYQVAEKIGKDDLGVWPKFKKALS